jgi:hypothetical protein
MARSPSPPLLQNRACLFRNTRLLSIRAVVISTAPAVTRRGRLANALLGQLALLQSTGASPLPPLLQIRACEFPSTRLLSIWAVVISTAQVVTSKGSLANALLGQLAFTTSEDVCLKLWPLSSTQAFPNTRPASAYPGHYPRHWLLEASYSPWLAAWLPAQVSLRASGELLRSLD